MEINSTKTVRDIALEMPQATRVFENLKIDYCCGGCKPLFEACATAGVEVASLVRMLEEADNLNAEDNLSLDLQNVSLFGLIRHILGKHHTFTKREMIRLENLIEKVFLAHGQNHPELEQVSEVFAWLSSELKPHMFKEEHMLFPYIIVLEVSMSDDQPEPDIPLFGTVQNPIRMMMTEHDRAGELLRELRNLTSNYTAPADGCISYRTLYQALEAFEKDLHQHIHLENNVLFPRAAQLEESRRSSERQVSGLSSAERFKSVAGKESVDLTVPMRP